MHINSENLKKIEECLIGLDSQISELQKILSRFVKSKEGGSCVITGVGGSGKSAIVKKVCKEFEHTVDVLFIDAYLHSESQASKIYDFEIESNEIPRIIVVTRFEHYAMKAKQQLLYRMLDASRTYPWFIICVSSREDCISLLEKRVRSRLLNIRICCKSNFTNEDFYQRCYKLLLLWGENKEWKRHVDILLSSSKVQTELTNFYNAASGYGHLKKLVILYGKYISEGLVNMNNENIFLKCIKLVFPFDDMFLIIEGLSLRELCLLHCLLRLINRERKLEFSYKKIVTEYILFCNQYDGMMKVDNSVLYKDLDGLCDMEVLVPISGFLHGHLEFKKIRLRVETSEVQRALDCIDPLPTKVKHWLEDKNV